MATGIAASPAGAGASGTSNVAAAARYGRTPVGTMAHSYVMSFPRELDADGRSSSAGDLTHPGRLSR